MQQSLILVALSFCFVFSTASADEMGPRFVTDSYGIRNVTPPRSMLATLAQEEPDIVLPALSARLMEGETDPPTVGIVRTLAGSSAPGSPARSVQSTGAVRVRLYLTGVSLPAGSVAWVFGDADDAVPFGDELLFNDTLWTPSVAGDVIRLFLPAGTRANIAAVGHQARGIATDGVECFIDASCTSFDDGRLASATSALYYVKDGKLTYCSGGLINAKVEDLLMLTANHCINTQAEAASVEAHWDFRTTSCNGPNAAFQRTYGASLLVTSAATDTTLLRMNSIPPGPRWLSGWTTVPVEPGTLLYRISHPQDPVSRYPFRQVYSVTRSTTSVPACAERPHSRYIYSTRVEGGTRSGSSGSPVVRSDGYIVGNKYGWCGYSEGVGCADDWDVDGSLRAAYPLLQPFLNPAGTAGCTPSLTTVCLLGSRFRVTVNYRNQFASPPQPGNFVAARLNASAVNPDVGIFGLTDPQATEIMVRIADARPFAPRFDVYYGGLTDLEYWVNVTDTVTGTTRSYHNVPGRLSAGLDRSSFPAN